MKVLFTAASRHGGTTSIGNEVARGLREAGHHAGVVERHLVEHLHTNSVEEIRCWAAAVADQPLLPTDSSTEGPQP